MGGEHDDIVSSFLAVTGASDAQARFFLESTNWELEAALISFFEAADEGVALMNPGDEDDEDEEKSVPVPVRVPALGASHQAGVNRQGVGAWPGRSTGSTPVHGRFHSSSQSKGKEKGSFKKGSSSRGGITTLSDLTRQPDSDGDSDEGPQEYYTGGEKSGMMVQDPTKRGPRDVDAMFDRVRRFGAQEGVAEPPHPVATASNKGVFAGASRTLNGESHRSEHSTPATAEGDSRTRAAPEPVFHTITFWQNGFTVDDGPLRRLDDPANEPFLESINKGECPRELEPADQNTAIHVNLVKKDEEWKAPPEPKYVAFRGTSRTLGGTTPPLVSEATTASAVTLETAPEPLQGLVVDEAKPSTAIQLRLSDGTRMVARFNYTHTVSDIRAFIDAARPGSAGPYLLQTMGFPPKQLTDLKQTIEVAGLLNAVVIQKA